MMDSHFADNLRSLRRRRNVSQAELAQAIDVSKAIISLWEHGKREPLMSSLVSISIFFDVSLDALVGFDCR